MHRLDDFSQLIKAFRDKGPRLLQGLVLGYCRLGRLVGTGSRMAELNLRGEEKIQRVLEMPSIKKKWLLMPLISPQQGEKHVPL